MDQALYHVGPHVCPILQHIAALLLILKESEGRVCGIVFLGSFTFICHVVQESCLKEQKSLEGAMVASGSIPKSCQQVRKTAVRKPVVGKETSCG